MFLQVRDVNGVEATEAIHNTLTEETNSYLSEIRTELLVANVPTQASLKTYVVRTTDQLDTLSGVTANGLTALIGGQTENTEAMLQIGAVNHADLDGLNTLLDDIKIESHDDSTALHNDLVGVNTKLTANNAKQDTLIDKSTTLSLDIRNFLSTPRTNPPKSDRSHVVL